jgi:hypothetical protein
VVYSQLLVQEMVNAAQGEQRWRDAPRNWSEQRSYEADKGGLAAGAQYMMGRALVRAGRYLQRGAAPRPEPLGS